MVDGPPDLNILFHLFFRPFCCVFPFLTSVVNKVLGPFEEQELGVMSGPLCADLSPGACTTALVMTTFDGFILKGVKTNV